MQKITKRTAGFRKSRLAERSKRGGIDRPALSPGQRIERGLDAGIRRCVLLLRAGGIETFESCEGGAGHAFFEPTVRFHGDASEGFKALAIALRHQLKVAELRRYYSIQDGEPHGPYWEMTFYR